MNAKSPTGIIAKKAAWVVACFLLVGLAGCIVAATTATVLYIASTMEYTATVEVPAKSQEVYDAMLRILQRRPDVEVVKRDDAKRCIEIRKGKNKATSQVTVADNGCTILKVTAQEGESEASHKDLSLRIVTQVCEELKVSYRVVEKKGLVGH